VFVAGLAALAGCMEDTIQNQIVAPGGAIFGRVTPVEAGTEVAAWQATKVKAVVVDAKGYFSIPDLEPGLYDVIATAPSGSHRLIHDVAVDRTQSTSLGSILLVDLPTPLLGFGPENGDADVPLANNAVFLLSEVELDVSSLAASVEVTPSLAGTWSQQYYPAQAWYYVLVTSQPLPASTSYQIHVGPGLRLASGSTWGSTLDYSFTTEGFRLRESNWALSGPIPATHRGRLCTLRFNVAIDPLTVAGAVHATGVEIQASVYDYYREYVEVSVLGGLVPGTEYALEVDNTLKDANGHALDQSELFAFSTEALRVTSSRFTGSQYGGTSVDPGGDLYAYVELNAPVDLAAFNAAASFDPPIAGVWIERSSSGQQSLEFFPEGVLDLIPGQSYVFRISGTVALVGAARLGADYVTGFTVQPVKVTSIYPSTGSRGVGTYTEITVQFNAVMDQASTESAFSLAAQGGSPVAGTFYWSGGQRFSFQPSSNLQAARSYVATVSTAALSAAGPALGTQASSYFRTQ
jgi:hypothetical protein